MTNIFKAKLFWLLSIAFIVTASYAFIYRIHPVVDARAYDTIAINILAGNGFREQPELPILFDTSITRAGPGYEYFLAGIYWLFGRHFEIVWLMQALLHVLTAYLLFLICKRLFPENGNTIGFIAAGIFAYHPDLIEISAMLMTETLYLFFTALVLWLFALSYERTDSKLLALVSGVVIALATLSRPMIALYGFIFVALYLSRKHYRQAIIFSFFAVLCMTPWIIRNYQIYAQFIPTTLIGEYNIWMGNRAGSTGGQIADGFNPATSYGEQFGYLNFKEEAVRQTKTFIFEHPGEFTSITAKRFVRFFSVIRPMGFWFYQTGWKQATFVFTSLLAITLIFIAGVAGYIRAYREKLPAVWYWLAFAVLVPLPLIFSVV